MPVKATSKKQRITTKTTNKKLQICFDDAWTSGSSRYVCAVSVMPANGQSKSDWRAGTEGRAFHPLPSVQTEHMEN
jgi:hypothetical protein